MDEKLYSFLGLIVQLVGYLKENLFPKSSRYVFHLDVSTEVDMIVGMIDREGFVVAIVFVGCIVDSMSVGDAERAVDC